MTIFIPKFGFNIDKNRQICMNETGEALDMANTLEQRLQRQLAQGATDDDFVVKQLRRQIAAKKSGQTAKQLYVTGSVKKEEKE